MKKIDKQKQLHFYFSQIRESFSVLIFLLEDKNFSDEKILEKHVKNLEKNFEWIEKIC